ncbi:HEPN domain-containing protein [Bdellovibrionota bacterium FG-1]
MPLDPKSKETQEWLAIAKTDLRYLGDLALTKDPTLSPLIDDAVSLNPYAVSTRYPGFADEIEPAEVEEVLVLAEKVYNEILKRLPQEIHP